MKYNYFTFFLSLFFTLGLAAQNSEFHRCHSTEIHEATYQSNADYRHEHDARMIELEQIKQQSITQGRLDCINPITIPIAVHYEGVDPGNFDITCLTDLALSQIEQLNQDFTATNPDFANYSNDVSNSNGGLALSWAAAEGVCVQFCLASANHPPTFGLQEGDYAITINQNYVANNNFPNFTNGAWAGYLNMFVVSDTGNAGLLGYSPLFGNGNGSGVVIGACVFGGPNSSCGNGFGGGNICPSWIGAYNMGRTVTHEVGHYLGCNHPWGQGNQGTESCNNDDGFTDTPNSDVVYGGCPNVGLSSTSCGSQDMFMNFMDYCNDACAYMFSEQQAVTMYNTASSIWNVSSDKCSAVGTINDASILSIIFPEEQTCETEIAPEVVLRNVGQATLTSVDVNYSIVGGGSNTFNWTGSLAQNESEVLTLSSISNGGSDFVLTVSTSNPNGVTDDNSFNDAKTRSVIVIQGASTPFFEDMESFTEPFPAQGITINDPDEDNFTWDRRPGASAYGNGVYSAYMKNYDAVNDNIGTEDWFILPELDATGYNSVEMTFDLAYAYFQDGNTTRTDGLKIMYAYSCSEVWEELWSDSGASLATAAPTSSLYLPNASNDWVNKSVAINTNGNNYVRFAFVSTCGRGNNLFIDNINVEGSGVIISNDNIESLNTFEISPNPSRGFVNMDIQFDESTDFNISIHDAVGREVYQTRKNGIDFQEQINVSDLSNGIYFVSLVAEDKIVTKKIILAK